MWPGGLFLGREDERGLCFRTVPEVWVGSSTGSRAMVLGGGVTPRVIPVHAARGGT